MAAWFAAAWTAPARVRTAIITRMFAGHSQPPYQSCNVGTRVGDQPTCVAANRRMLRAALELPGEPLWLRQVHGTSVVEHGGGALEPAREPEADAAIARTAGAVLSVQTADCLPILIAAGDGNEIAAIHAGWRGLAAGVIEATMTRMRGDPADCHVFLGPAAGPRQYEVGVEVRDAFIDCDKAAAAAFVATRHEHWLCDLYALARARLHACGVTQIHGGNRCTISEPEHFFSHRREPITGRIASLIWIQP